MAARVHDVVGKFAVIRQQQQSFGVLVQSADGVNPFFHAVQQVHDTAAVEFIGSSGDIASRLVQHEITLYFSARDANGFSVDRNEVGTGCLVAELDGMSIQLDFSGSNQGFRLAAGAVASIG